MRKILFILFLLPVIVQAQSINNQKVRWTQPIYFGGNDSTSYKTAADTSVLLFNRADSTLYLRYKGSYRAISTGGSLSGYVPSNRTITINGTTQDLSANRTFNVGTLTIADSATFSTKDYRQKGLDSVQANLIAGLALKLNITDTASMLSPYYRTALANATIVQHITDSLRALVRLRAQGSGGIEVQNSSGTSVASFGSGGTTNISLNGSTNVNARLNVTDSIVGVNQRLTGELWAIGSVGVGTTNPISKFTVQTSNNRVEFNELNSTTATIEALNTSRTLSNNLNFYGRGFNFFGRVGGSGSYTQYVSISDAGALTATAQGNNIAIGVDSSVTTTTYTLVLGDAGYLKRCSNASAITITVPTNASVAFPIGTTIYFSQQGAGKVSVSPASSTVTIQSEGNLLGTAGQHAVIGLIKVNSDRWLLVGNRG